MYKAAAQRVLDFDKREAERNRLLAARVFASKGKIQKSCEIVALADRGGVIGSTPHLGQYHFFLSGSHLQRMMEISMYLRLMRTS